MPGHFCHCHVRPFFDVRGARSLSALVYLIVVVVQFEHVLWMFFDCELPTNFFFRWTVSKAPTHRRSVKNLLNFECSWWPVHQTFDCTEMLRTKNLAWTRNGDRSFDGVSVFLKSVHMSLRGQIFC